ncbi:MAG: DciA family protein [Lonepinella koalarum]|nr:DciA family protein [Lonepinella koalarum]
MRRQKTLNIKQILNSSDFAGLMKKGLMLNNLNLQLQENFLPEFKGLYQIVNVKEENLHIDVKNASVRQALLFKQEELLQIIRQYYPIVEHLKFNVNPHLYSHT